MKNNRLIKKSIKESIIRLLIITLFITLFINIHSNIVEAATKTNNVVDANASNNNLKTLEIEGYEISPEFNENTTNYYVSIPTTIQSVEVNAVPDSDDATVKITGNTKLNKTENTVKVIVTSKNKTTKTYTININKQEDNGLKLSKLEIEGASLQPEFVENKYYYSTSLTQSNSAKKLNIIATPKNASATVEIIGNDETLQEGENLITIIVKDDTSTTIYQVNVNITIETSIISNINNNNFANTINNIKDKTTEFFKDETKTMAFLIATAVVLLILVISLILKIIKNNKAEQNRENIKKRAK